MSPHDCHSAAYDGVMITQCAIWRQACRSLAIQWSACPGFLSGCATAPPPKPPVRPAVQPRAPTEDDRFRISAALAPLLRTTGDMAGPGGRLRGGARDPADEDHQPRRGAAPDLPLQPPRDRGRAGAASARGAARGARARAGTRGARARRWRAGRADRQERGAGPMLSRQPAELAKFRAYDRDEERAADRYAVELLEPAAGRRHPMPRARRAAPAPPAGRAGGPNTTTGSRRTRARPRGSRPSRRSAHERDRSTALLLALAMRAATGIPPWPSRFPSRCWSRSAPASTSSR